MAKSNRSKRRKESKRIEEVISDESSLMDKFYIVGGVVLFILCFYILTVYITNKNNTDGIHIRRHHERYPVYKRR